MKTCTGCLLEKEESEFYLQAGKPVSRCKVCVRSVSARTRERNRREDPQRLVTYMRRYKLARNYQMTPEEFEAMAAGQDGRCAICRRPSGQLVVDHDHDTGAVRGLLCNPCNRGLGILGDTAEAVDRAIAYLGGCP